MREIKVAVETYLLTEGVVVRLTPSVGDLYNGGEKIIWEAFGTKASAPLPDPAPQKITEGSGGAVYLRFSLIKREKAHELGKMIAAELVENIFTQLAEAGWVKRGASPELEGALTTEVGFKQTDLATLWSKEELQREEEGDEEVDFVPQE